MPSEAQKKATKEYRKRSVKRVCVDFYPADEDLYHWLKSQDGIARYVRELIRADMEAHLGKSNEDQSTL